MKRMSWEGWLGLLLLLLGLAWWGIVFYFVSEQAGEAMSGFVSCTVLPSEHCNFYRAMAWLKGINPYEPGIIWVALVLLLRAKKKDNPWAN